MKEIHITFESLFLIRMIDFFKSQLQKYLLTSVGLLIFTFIFSNNLLASEIIFDKAHSPYYLDSTLTIGENDTLIILEGTTIIIDTAVDIIVYGNMFINGTAIEPVKILPKTDSIGWGQIKLLKKGSHCKFEHAEIVDGTVIAIAVNLIYRNLHFVNRQKLSSMHNITRVAWGSADLQNCSVQGSGKGEGFHLKNMDRGIIRQCEFRNIPDAIEWTRVKNSRITNNLFVDNWDDAIDLNNCSNILIDSNTIIHAFDRGIEIGSERFGSSTNITVHRNLITNCKEGITFKEGSTGLIINNTLYQNKYGVVCKELIEGSGGSKINIVNTIISQSKISSIESDSLSEVMISYSLSDKTLMEGVGNIFTNPQFTDSKNKDFSLKHSSPCINAGSSFEPIDPDGTISDMGANFHNPESEFPALSKETKVQFFNAFPETSGSALKINYHLPHSTKVVIGLYNSKGEKLKTLIDKTQIYGDYTIHFIEPIENGIYLCKITLDREPRTFKVAFAY